MKEVRSGVRLRKASERSYSPVPVKPEQSLFKKLLDDIKYKRYFLHKVMRNNKPRTSSETLLDFGLLRSLLKPVTARKLRDAPSSSPSLHKLLMKEIQSGVRKLHPVSPDVESQSSRPFWFGTEQWKGKPFIRYGPESSRYLGRKGVAKAFILVGRD
ncbi:protein spire homolog 1-like isoform X2 [Narcine bancroftii]|uniref:protein spire homolog 1-like isoform X2 n=1 Tax=Narcine bancroftii TaxID=1343680 RepID=UPI0038312871